MSVYVAELDMHVNVEDLEVLKELLNELKEEAKKNQKKKLLTLIEQSKLKEKYSEEIKTLKAKYGVTV
ncbi:MAG: hypothetical protein QXR81_08340 [Candidatus Nezhaarchaeales archaeon]